jgi:SAM-dependent methyltransferase
MSFPSSAAIPQPAALAAWLRRLLGRGAAAQPAERPPFDALHGVDTAGLIYSADLPTGHPHDRYNEGYYATAPSLFAEAIDHWRQTLVGCAAEDYAFIDLGCGKGRVLLLASELPFRSVCGIELNPRLARTARRNVQRWLRRPRACRRVAVQRADVLDLELPAGPVVLYLFNSFSADVLAPLMERLAAVARQRSAPIDLIYVHPDHDGLIAATRGIEKLGWAQVPFSQEDAAADAFGVSRDCFYIYRFQSRSA